MEHIAKPFRDLKMTLKRAKRTALEQLFLVWLKDYAPRKFTRAAFGLYREYDDSAKKDIAAWQAKNAWRIKAGLKRRSVSPAKDSGALEESILRGSHTFGSGLEKLAVRWPGAPRYATRPNRFSGFEVGRAITEVSDDDYRRLRETFAALLEIQLRKSTFGGAHYGQAVLAD